MAELKFAFDSVYYHVSDIERSIAFYRDVLGFRPVSRDYVARFEVGDLFEADIASATVVMLYLLPDLNLRLRPKLLKELAPGTRIVCHAFDMGDWTPEKKRIVENSPIYLWTIPPK